MKLKLKKCWQWLKENVFTKDMIIPFIIAEIIFWSPCIVTGLLAVLVSPWWWTVFSAIIAFWAGPFTPALPLQFGLAVIIKKLFRRKKENGTRTKEGSSRSSEGR